MARTDPGDAVMLGDVILHYRLNARTHMREEREVSSPVVTSEFWGMKPFPRGLSPHYARATRDPISHEAGGLTDGR